MWIRTLALASGLALTVAGCTRAAAPQTAAPPLVLERAIPLPGVTGRIDHLAFDARRGRLLVAELGAGQVEAVDLAGAAPTLRIAGLRTPQGVAWLPDVDELAVASGGDGTVRFYRAADLAPTAVLSVGDDADNLRVDPRDGRLVVGYGAGALAVIDPATHAVLRRLDLPDHPEAFRLAGDQVLVNVPDAHAILAADLAAGRILATWKAAHGWNFPMALEGGVVAVVYRFPARLEARDAATGQVRADLATCGDADDLFFDPPRSRLYVACGSGAVQVVDTRAWRELARIPTRPGARTALFLPDRDRLVVAARASGGHEAELLVFRPQP